MSQNTLIGLVAVLVLGAMFFVSTRLQGSRPDEEQVRQYMTELEAAENEMQLAAKAIESGDLNNASAHCRMSAYRCSILHRRMQGSTP